MAIWNFALATGATMGSVIGGYISQDLSWRWNFGLAAIALGLLWIGFMCFLPETVYIRDIRYNLDEQSHEDLSGGFEKNAEGDAIQGEVTELPPKVSYLQQLRPWTGKVYDHDSMFFLFVANLRLFQDCLPSRAIVLLSCDLLGDALLRHIGYLAWCLWRYARASICRSAVQLYRRSSWSHRSVVVDIWHDRQRRWWTIVRLDCTRHDETE